MAPENIREVGRLVSLEPVTLTEVAVQVSASSRPTMSVSIQADADNANDILIGDQHRQTHRIAARDIYTIKVGDANNVWMRSVSGTAVANPVLIVPPGG